MALAFTKLSRRNPTKLPDWFLRFYVVTIRRVIMLIASQRVGIASPLSNDLSSFFLPLLIICVAREAQMNDNSHHTLHPNGSPYGRFAIGSVNLCIIVILDSSNISTRSYTLGTQFYPPPHLARVSCIQIVWLRRSVSLWSPIGSQVHRCHPRG
jgi:hypothetical protein